MSSRARRIGTAAEGVVERFLRAKGWLARRNPLRGTRDEGDIWTPNMIISVKDDASHRIGEWLRDAETQAGNAGVPYYVVVVKERRSSHQSGQAPRWWVVMRLDQFADIFEAAAHDANA